MIVRFTRAAYDVLLALCATAVGVETHAYLVGLRLAGELVVLHLVHAANSVATTSMVRPDYGASAVALKPYLDRGLVVLGEVHTHLGMIGLSGFDEQMLRDLPADFAGYVAVVITTFLEERSPVLRAASITNGVLTSHDVVVGDAPDALLPAHVATQRVLHIGAGSLGSLVALQASKLGVQAIAILDHDTFDAGNLRRNLPTRRAIGRSKAAWLARFLRPRTTSRMRAVTLQIGPATDDTLCAEVRAHDVIVNATGNPRVGFQVSRAAVAEQRLTFHAGVFARGAGGFVFRQDVGGPCYECLYALKPRPISEDTAALDTLQRQYGYTDEELSAHLGLWADVNLVAALQAKLLAAYLQGAVFPNLHVVDTTTLTITSVNVQRRPGCTTCKGDKQ